MTKVNVKTRQPRHWTPRSRKCKHRRKGFFQTGNRWTHFRDCVVEEDKIVQENAAKDVPSTSNDTGGKFCFLFLVFLRLCTVTFQLIHN
jgi:hypothetical protein